MDFTCCTELSLSSRRWRCRLGYAWDTSRCLGSAAARSGSHRVRCHRRGGPNLLILLPPLGIKFIPGEKGFINPGPAFQTAAWFHQGDKSLPSKQTLSHFPGTGWCEHLRCVYKDVGLGVKVESWEISDCIFFFFEPLLTSLKLQEVRKSRWKG